MKIMISMFLRMMMVVMMVAVDIGLQPSYYHQIEMQFNNKKNRLIDQTHLGKRNEETKLLSIPEINNNKILSFSRFSHCFFLYITSNKNHMDEKQKQKYL